MRPRLAAPRVPERDDARDLAPLDFALAARLRPADFVPRVLLPRVPADFAPAFLRPVRAFTRVPVFAPRVDFRPRALADLRPELRALRRPPSDMPAMPCSDSL